MCQTFFNLTQATESFYGLLLGLLFILKVPRFIQTKKVIKMKLVSDICEICEENGIISCLKERFMQDHIYVSIN